MKAIYIESNGTADVLQYTNEFSMPELKPNEALIKIESTSLNRIDTVVRRGYPGLSLPFPHILGGDISGTVEDSGSTSFKKGERVVAYPIVLPESLNPIYGDNEQLNDGWKYFGMHLPGSYAEYVAVPEQSLVRIPENVSFETASTMPVAGLTAYHAIYSVARLTEGNTFLIWGASGGLGTIAIKLAKIAGATVIATTGKNEKMQALKEIGADYVFNHFDESLESEIRSFFPNGLDVILDYVGPQTFSKSFNLVRKGGKILLCGMLTGMETNLHIQQTYFRHISILGLYLGTRKELAELMSLLSENRFEPVIASRFDLKDAAIAHQLLESGNYIGKILLKP